MARNEGSEEKADERVAEDGRSVWNSRWAFWLAAVGSAVGLGNLWRFPWQCATWGGGPFIITYLLCLFFIGMPILTQELALGQKHRSGDIEAFGRMNWRLRGIGLASVIGAFGITTYYSTVIGMSLVFLFASMQKNLPYDSDHASWWATDVLEICGYPPSSDCAQDNFSWKVYLATVLVYIITYFCIFKGVKSASQVVKLTMPLPLLFLLILLIRTSLLKGAGDGVEEYLDFNHWDELKHSGVWDAAVGQCFFSLSVCMGVMTAYGSYNPIKQNIAFDEKVISLLDLFTSLFAGFVVYTVLGHLNHVNPSGDWYNSATFGLVFSAYPVAITELGDAQQLFGILFFLVLFLLGIDSLFSLVEALTTVIVDSDVGRMFNLKHQSVSLFTCVAGVAISSIYCLGSGIYWLDIVDRYINNYGMVFLGICESVSVGWFYATERQTSQIGEKAIQAYRGGFFFSVLAALIVGFLVDEDYDYIGIIVGFGCLFFSFLLGYVTIEPSSDLTFSQKLWYLIGWEGTEELRDFINCNGIGDEWMETRHTCKGEFNAFIHHSGVSIFWGFLIKYFIPVILSVILVSTMQADDEERYEGYQRKHLAIGIVIFSCMVAIVFLIALFPSILKQTSDSRGRIDGTNVAVHPNEMKSMSSAKTKQLTQSEDDDGNAGTNINVVNDDNDDIKEDDKEDDEAQKLKQDENTVTV